MCGVCGLRFSMYKYVGTCDKAQALTSIAQLFLSSALSLCQGVRQSPGRDESHMKPQCILSAVRLYHRFLHPDYTASLFLARPTFQCFERKFESKCARVKGPFGYPV